MRAAKVLMVVLIVDRVGFKALLWFAAACHLLGLVIILRADGYWPLYWGTFVLSLGNGAVEAGIGRRGTSIPDEVSKRSFLSLNLSNDFLSIVSCHLLYRS